MAQNFIACDRGQTMLMPPDLSDWVPDDHVVWSILGAVEQMDLTAFYGEYRENGQGRAAYEPAMMARCCCMRTRAGTVRPAGSSGSAGRMLSTS
jgi:transposase